MAWDDTKVDGDIVEPTEWNAMIENIKKRLGLVFNVQSYNASPDGTTTTTGSITAATDDLVVASNSTFAINQGIVVIGAVLDVTDTGNTEDTDNDFTTTGGAADNEWMARGFTATNSGAIGAIADVMLKKTGAPAGTILATIYTDDGGSPSGPTTTQVGGNSTAITNTTLNASGAIQTFTWATDWPVLTTGVKYWLVLKTAGYTYTNGVTEVIWQTDANGSVGNDECWKYDSNAGTPWTTMGPDVGADITVNYNLSTTIAALSGTALTLAANATVTVSSALVRHDEVTAIGAAHSAATVDGGWVFFPVGVYNLSTDLSFNADSPLWFDPGATLAINSGVTATFLNMIPPTHTVFSGSGSMAFGEQTITGVGDTILANAETVMLNPNADYTLTSTPTIANGTPGQRIIITAPNSETNTVTLQDQDTLPSSNLQLLTSTRDISGKKMLQLQFDGTNWVEIGSSPMTSYIPGAYYREDGDKWQYEGIAAADQRYTLQSPARLLVDIDDTMYLISTKTDYDLSVAATWDTTGGTDYTVAANRAGKDFYIYAIQPASGTTPLIEISDNSSAPDGYNTSNSRKIGGFHCLCVAVGTIGGHTLTGFVVGDILPQSVWDYTHRPISEPEGMVYSDGASIWVDIYLASGTGGSTVSVNGGTISDTRDWMDFCDDGAAVKKRLLWDMEFSAIASGSNEETNISGSADPGTTGGHSDTAGRRMISDIGVEDACGVVWQWLLDQSYRYDAGDHVHTTTITHKGGGATGSAVSKDQAETNFNAVLGSGADEMVNTSSVDPDPAFGYYNLPGAKGSLYRQGIYGDVKLRAGGAWGEGTSAGSRARFASSWRWSTGTHIGGRLCAELR